MLEPHILLIIRLLSLFLLLWFGTWLGITASRGHRIEDWSMIIPAAAATAFTWSMGWLG